MKNQFYIMLIVLIICILALTFSSCAKTKETTSSEDKQENTAAPDPETFLTENIIIDGSMDSHEYLFSLKDETTGLEVYWSNDRKYIYIDIIAGSSGWTAIGFNPEFAMKGANIIFMAINGKDIVMRDDFGNSTFSHSPDEDLGGSFDVEEYAVKVDGDVAMYELKMLLDSGDEFDGVLNAGEEYKVILSVNDRVIDFDSKHTKKSSSQIQLAQ
jgi:hypothetical protein